MRQILISAFLVATAVGCGKLNLAPRQLPPPPPPPTTGSASIQEKIGTTIADGLCVLTADTSHMARAREVWNNVYNYEPAEKGGSFVILRSLDSSALGLKVSIVAAREVTGKKNCDAVSKAFYDYTWGLVQSMLLSTKALYVVGGLTVSEFYAYWDIAQKSDSNEMQAHYEKLGKTLGNYLKEEGKILAGILFDSLLIMINPNGANLESRLQGISDRIQRAQSQKLEH